MQFFSFGINHHQVTLELRDKFAVDQAALRDLYRSIEVSEFAEYVLVSTCNRTECILYGLSSDQYNIQQAFSKIAGEPWPEQAFLYQDEEAVSHILEVTAGLDSLVIGDAQILGQIKDAYRIAVEEECVGAALHRLMHTSFTAAKRVVNETQLTSGSSSVAGTAASLARHVIDARVGDARRANCLVVGAGHMGRLVVDALHKNEDIDVSVTNRTIERAEQLTCSYPKVNVISWADRYQKISTSDVVIVTSGAPGYVIDPSPLSEIENESPLQENTLVIDISVPRNVNPAVSDLHGYQIYDLDDLQEKIDGVLNHRTDEMPAARAICAEMLADFVSWCFHHQAMQPAIRAILDTFDSIRRQEIERNVHRFVDADLDQLNRITKSIMQKVLAVPVVRLKNVGPDQIDYVNGIKLLQTLFARNSCEEPNVHQLNHSEQMFEAITTPEAASLSNLATCPFDEEDGSTRSSEAVSVEIKNRTLKLGTRGSALALWQANHVQGLLEQAGYKVEQERITTRGDQILDKPLALIEGKSLFTKELDVALIEGKIDLAVHSLKDLPSQLPPGLRLAAISPRENPMDAFVAHPSFEGTLEDLREGAIIGTSSLRRTAQLKAWRPDLQVMPIRGNVDTRLAKLDASNWDGIVLAAAGLIRIGFEDRIHTIFEPSLMLPAVGQGALGIVCAESNKAVAQALIDTIHNANTAAAVRSERAFLNCLEGSCHVPVGGYAKWNDQQELILHGLVASLDGTEVVRGEEKVDPDFPEEAGIVLAQRLLEAGAGEILQLVKL